MADRHALTRRIYLSTVTAGLAASAVSASPANAAGAAGASLADQVSSVRVQVKKKRCLRKGCVRSRGHRGRHRPRRAPSTPSTPPSHATTPAPTGGGDPSSPPPGPLDSFGLSKQDRVIASRFSEGLTPALVDEVVASGGGIAWFSTQLARAVPDMAASVGDWWPELHLTPTEAWKRNNTGVMHGSVIHHAVAARELVRRIISPDQVLEAVAEFWHQHLHVPCDNGAHFAWRADYTEVLRRHSLGQFSDLLPRTALHPAMLTYLNAASSFASHPSENLARELLELHTVGAGNYSEDDVKNCARILTGYRVGETTGFVADYRAAEHWVGPVKVLGFTHANASLDGRQVSTALMAYLATHPHTANRIARRLCQNFVADQPSEALVDRMAKVYLDSQTSISSVLRALISTDEFIQSGGIKLRNPEQDVVATFRTLGRTFAAPTSSASFSLALGPQVFELGVPALSWPTPDGAPVATDRWATPARALASFKLHWGVATNAWQLTDLTLNKPGDWVPHFPLTMGELVQALSRQVLCQDASPELVSAVCWSAQVSGTAVITRDHHLVNAGWGRLVSLFLEHPARYYR